MTITLKDFLSEHSMFDAIVVAVLVILYLVALILRVRGNRSATNHCLVAYLMILCLWTFCPLDNRLKSWLLRSMGMDWRSIALYRMFIRRAFLFLVPVLPLWLSALPFRKKETAEPEAGHVRE